MLLASASLIGGVDHAYGDSPVVDVSSAPIPAERAGNDVELMAPTNSTLEIRIARRPWLFDRLTKPQPAPSIKMNPPTPPRPVSEPPAAKRITPDSDADAWKPRETDPSSLFSDRNDSAGKEVAGNETPSSEVAGKTPGGTSFADVTTTPSPSTNPPTHESQTQQSQRAEAMSDVDTIEQNSRHDQEHPADNEEPLPLRDPVDTADQEDMADLELGWNENDSADPPGARDNASASADTVTDAADTVTDAADEERSQAEPDEHAFDESTIGDSEGGTERSRADLEALDQEVTDEGATNEVASEDVASDQTMLDEEVTVRKLRINRDGTPAGGLGAEEMDGDDEVSQHREGASIGDLADGVTVEDESDSAAMPEEAESSQTDLDYTGYPRKPIRLTSSVYRIQMAMKQCLRYYYARPENANERSNWGMLHEIMVYGADTKIIAGNKSYSAIAWIAGNNPCRGHKLIEERDGRITATSGIGLQGHQAQMLAIFALADVPADYPLYAGNRRFTVNDLVQQEMLACRSGEELTFTLIGLSHYLDTEEVWRNESGETWDFQRLLREELAQPIVGAACGGTHRLMGYAHALRKRRAEGGPIDGQWKRADVYVQDFVQYVYRLQNRDGSMSTDWFEGREDNGDLDRKIQTTGHMVEWLLTVTPDAQLQDPRLVNAVRFLLSSMYNDRTRDWKVGPKGHALRSLAMYYERVYQQGPAWRAAGVATGQSNQRR